jgi:hypothetical protein
MDEQLSKSNARAAALRDRRYAIRFPFAADVEMIDLEAGTKADGVTSDLSLGGCFVCSSKPLRVKSRVRITLRWKSQTLEALGVLRIVKPRIGMGIEFLDVEDKHIATLKRWLDHLRNSQ